MSQTGPIPIPPTTLVQHSQFYLSMGSPGSYSPMVLDMPQSRSQNSPVPLIDLFESSISVPHFDATATPRASENNQITFIPDDSTKPSPFEDALVEEFMNSITISGPNSDEFSGSNSNDVENENVQPKALNTNSKKTLAIRRGMPKLLDLHLLNKPRGEAFNTARSGLEDRHPITPLGQMIPKRMSPPPAPKPRQTPLLTIKNRRASTNSSTRTVRSGRFTNPTTYSRQVNTTRLNPGTPILDMASFLTISKEPNLPLLSPIQLTPERSFGVYRPMSSPMDTDFDLYGPTPGQSPTQCVHAG